MTEKTFADINRIRLRIAILICGLLLPASFQLYGGIDLLFEDFIGPFLLWTAWAYLPYLILFGLSFKVKKNLLIFLPFLLLILIELVVQFQVAMTKSHDTSSVILTFLPLYQLLITIPFAMLIGWIVDKVGNRKLPPRMRKL